MLAVRVKPLLLLRSIRQSLRHAWGRNGAVNRAGLALLFAGLFLVAAAPAPLVAQDFGRVVSPILTLDRERLFAGTLYGQRVNRELEAASTAMAAETRAIEAALEAEEQELTDKRATMEPEAFRELATAFDDKVQALRAERDAAETDLLAQIEAAQLAFFNRIGPVLGQLVRDRGAVLIVDRRAVLLAATNVDITAAAIERIDAVLGDGGDIGVPQGGADGTTGGGALDGDLGDDLGTDLGTDLGSEGPTQTNLLPGAATGDDGTGDIDPEVDTIPAPQAPAAPVSPGDGAADN